MENKPDLSRKINLVGCRFSLHNLHKLYIYYHSILENMKNPSKKLPWGLVITVVTILVSTCFSLLSNLIFDSASLLTAFLVLMLIVVVGIVFDMIGVAITAADEVPFHAMASRRVPEAKEAIWLLRNAAKVGSFCNDVIGDICGVVSGSAAAAISVSIVHATGLSGTALVSVGLSALVAGATVGGKACGKSMAIRNSTKIVRMTARVIHAVKTLPRRKKK